MVGTSALRSVAASQNRIRGSHPRARGFLMVVDWLFHIRQPGLQILLTSCFYSTMNEISLLVHITEPPTVEQRRVKSVNQSVPVVVVAARISCLPGCPVCSATISHLLLAKRKIVHKAKTINTMLCSSVFH